eukprot:SAG11_NODE_1635_length_4539_cov_2.188514_4_plen_67_part_00
MVVRNHPSAQLISFAQQGKAKAGPRVLIVDAFWIHSYSSHRVVYRQIRRLVRPSTRPLYFTMRAVR